MIGFDLDGVLCPEYIWLDGVSRDVILKMSRILAPIFQPSGEYCIVTGRNNSEITLEWITEKLNVKPMFVYINVDNISPALFKQQIIQNNNIETFIESEFAQVEYLRNNTTKNIIHINDLFKGLYEERN